MTWSLYLYSFSTKDGNYLSISSHLLCLYTSFERYITDDMIISHHQSSPVQSQYSVTGSDWFPSLQLYPKFLSPLQEVSLVLPISLSYLNLVRRLSIRQVIPVFTLTFTFLVDNHPDIRGTGVQYFPELSIRFQRREEGSPLPFGKFVTLKLKEF